MNRYKITIDYKLTISKRLSTIVMSNSREEAEKTVIDKMDPDRIKIIGVETNFIPYRTELWRELEDLLFDDDIVDKSDVQYILDQLVDKEFKKAANRYKSLDESIKNKIPATVVELFSSLELLN